MQTYKIYHVDSFTHVPFGGNPTVAVLDADTLTDEKMQKIAREMNLSETGFVLRSSKADFLFRFFTPTKEVKFCGHATVGALSALYQEGKITHKQKLTIETHVGILNVEISLVNSSPSYILNLPPVNLVKPSYSIEELAQTMQVPLELLDLTKPLLLDTTQNYLYFTVKDLKNLEKFTPELRQTTEFANKHGVVVFCALTNQTFNSRHLHARGFAHLVGLPEDPFTGSMQGGLVAYAKMHDLLPLGIDRWVGVEQGHFMGRPGYAWVEITNQEPFQARLHGEAVPLYSAELSL